MMKAKAKRKEGVARFKALALTVGLTLLIIISAIPWPWMEIGRALFRGIS